MPIQRQKADLSISIHDCNKIDTHNNIYMDAKSDSLVGLAITSTLSLQGSVQYYVDIESRIEINKGIIG